MRLFGIFCNRLTVSFCRQASRAAERSMNPSGISSRIFLPTISEAGRLWMRSEAGLTRITFASPSHTNSPSDEESMIAWSSRVMASKLSMRRSPSGVEGAGGRRQSVSGPEGDFTELSRARYGALVPRRIVRGGWTVALRRKFPTASASLGKGSASNIPARALS